MKKRRLNIELTARDQEHMMAVQRRTGETTAVGAIRAALREAAEKMGLAQRTDLIETLIGIRDTARTGLPPAALSMTEDEWVQHRLNVIAGDLSHLLDEL